MIDSNIAVTLSSAKNHLAKVACNVHKFGGSSLATSACVERVVDIIRQHCQLNDIIVVSANGNTTDALFNLYQLAVELQEITLLNTEQVSTSNDLNTLREHLRVTITALDATQAQLIDQLLNASSAARLKSLLKQDVAQITEHLLSDRLSDLLSYQNDLLAFGEVWSARLLSAVLSESVCPSYMLDARDFLLLKDEKIVLLTIA
jgi:aspartokinase/homoserine dehydrogenase 2